MKCIFCKKETGDTHNVCHGCHYDCGRKPSKKTDYFVVNQLGKILRKFRVDKELTLKDMATSLNTNPAQLCAIEISKKDIDNELAEKIVNQYGIEIIKELGEQR